MSDVVAEAWPWERLEERGEATAAIDDTGNHVSYAELGARADALAARIGSTRRLILLEGANTVEWLVAYLAALRGRHPVLIAPGGAPGTLAALEHQFRPALRLCAGDGYTPRAVAGGGEAALHPELAVMLSTSGSTGSTKCVRLSRRNIAANAASIAEYLAIGPDERGAVNLPTHYSYGLSIVNSHLRAGATLLMTGRSAIEPEFWAFLARERATSFAGVPHVYELIARGDLAAQAPPSLRYFTQAGGRLPVELAQRFGEIAAAHGWRFHVMYGQTEATARIAHLPPEELARHPDCIGIAIPGGRLSLIDGDGGEIAAAEVEGELVYDGPNVMMGYATGPEELALPSGPNRLATGDLGRRNQAGLFRITGRQSRFIKIFGNRIGLDDVERLLGDAGHRAIATGSDERLVVATQAGDAEPINALLMERLKLPRTHFTVLQLEEFPLLPSGKVDCAAICALAEPAADAEAAPTVTGSPVQDAFVAVFGEGARDPGASFTSLGGDSLSYVTVALALERALPALPENWESLSIATLSGMAGAYPAAKTRERPSVLARLDTVRTLAAMLVVAYHVVGSDPTTGLRLPMTSAWHHAVDSFWLLRMPLFTALAGFLYAAMPSTKDGLRPFIARRARQIAAPLVFATLVFWCGRLLAGERVPSLLSALAFGYLHLWYLYTLFGAWLVAALTDRFLGPDWRPWCGLALISVAASLGLPQIGFVGWNALRSLMPLFVLGVLLARYPVLLASRALLVAAVIGLVLAVVVQQLTMAGEPTAQLWVAMSWIGAAGGVIAMLRLVPVMPAIAWIAPYTFAIYLWHPLATGGTRRIMAELFGVTSLPVVFVVAMTAGLFVPILIQRAVRDRPWLSLPVIGR